MKHNKLMMVFAFILVASMVLSACQPQTIIQTVEVEKVVEKPVEVEKIVEKVVEQTSIVEVERGAFTELHPILGDLRIRQAMAYCTNKVELAMAGYPLLTEEQAQKLVMDTFIPKNHWAYAGDENVTIYPFDPEKGAALLEEAGWPLPEGAAVRTKEDGSVLALKFYTTTAAFRQAWAAVWERQMADCGIQILRSHVPASWWFGDTTGLQVRDFEIGAYAWVGQADPGGVTLWACDYIPLPENNWTGQNYMGWCNEAADEGIKNANNTLDQDERIEWFTIVQQEYTKDVPAIPIFNRTETFAHAADLEGFAPIPGEEYYIYNVEEWARPGLDTVVLGLTQEPASLYSLVESAFVQRIAVYPLGGRSYTSLNYDYQPLLLTEIPTLDNGMAVLEDVEVTEGTKVVDATGEVVELAAGVKVKDATGAEVEFTGDPITMKQLTATFDYIDEITWQDGTPISEDDLRLNYEVSCDPESGATSFYVCDRVAEVVFNGTEEIFTYVPGMQDPTFFTFGYDPVPSIQPIESDGPYKGMVLADVPAKDWPTLPEVAEKPWSFGPYILTNWVKGEKMEYEANPYYWKGAPASAKFVISFVTAENAEAQLLAGQVDILGSETLAGLTEQLVAAEQAGDIKTIINTGATWEHIDFNMYVK